MHFTENYDFGQSQFWLQPSPCKPFTKYSMYCKFFLLPVFVFAPIFLVQCLSHYCRFKRFVDTCVAGNIFTILLVLVHFPLPRCVKLFLCFTVSLRPKRFVVPELKLETSAFGQFRIEFNTIVR